MSLKYALLGFLNYGPHTGYELKKFFDISVAHFWNAELSQIYPTLKTLESEGMVDMDVQVQADRPNRKVYAITDDGRRELVEWLAKPADADQIREPFLIKLFFGSSLSKSEIIAVLRHRAEELRAAGAQYERGCGMARQFAGAIGLEREALFWELAIESGVRHNESALDWIESAIKRLEREDDAVFQSKYTGEPKVDIRTRVDVLEKLKKSQPEVFANDRAG
jgi:DNA-binding PadR family transcriptional regulator